jgi:hypothetical protein
MPAAATRIAVSRKREAIASPSEREGTAVVVVALTARSSPA